MLYVASGTQSDAFGSFPIPRHTLVFGPTFRGEGAMRIADVKRDPRYGKNEPYFGMPGGHPAVSSYLAQPVISRSGKVLGALLFGHAVPGVFTEREERLIQGLAPQIAIAMDNARLYDAERSARSDAETANRAKDEFLATLSHELRTPLNAILGWADIMRSGELERADADRALDSIERNARALAELVADLLDVSRIIRGKLRLEVSGVDLPAVIHSAIDSVVPTAEAKGVELATHIDEPSGEVLADPNRLQQVLWNLLSNAVKFTPRGGRVEVRLSSTSSHAVIEVRDNGQGISPDVLPRVFERFWQADRSPTRTSGGLGLGLALVRHLIELHGGTVRAESPGEGMGATFVLTIPLVGAKA
jgi:signal transduction histidine kinase